MIIDTFLGIIKRISKDTFLSWRCFTYFVRLRWVACCFIKNTVYTVSLFSIPMCLLVNQHLSLLARKFPETKFVKAIVNSCIQHYHDTCLPTIFVYKNGQIEGKFIGIIECGGVNLKLEGNDVLLKNCL